MRGKKKFFIIGGSVLAVGTLVFALCVLVFGKSKLNDDYFISNEKRAVLNTDIVSSNLMFGAIKSHTVYTFEDEKVKDLTVYYEFKDDAAARDALESMKKYALEDTQITEVYRDSKYIATKYNAEKFKDSHETTIRKNVERTEALQYHEPPAQLESDPTEPNEEIKEEPEE